MDLGKAQAHLAYTFLSVRFKFTKTTILIAEKRNRKKYAHRNNIKYSKKKKKESCNWKENRYQIFF